MGLQLRFLGQPKITLDDRDITADLGAKPLALMAYLALARSPRVPRARLAATFWSEKTDEASRYRLRYALWELRRTLGKDCVLSDDDACWLGGGGDAWIDVQEFIRGCQCLGVGSPLRRSPVRDGLRYPGESFGHPNPLSEGEGTGPTQPVARGLVPRIQLSQKVERVNAPPSPAKEQTASTTPLSLSQKGEGTRGSPLSEEQAIDLANTLSPLADLCRGELLDGLAVREAPLFEEWLLAERERLDLLYQEALWQLARAQRAAGLHADAVRTLERLIAADPLRERCYRALMGLHARQGDPATALRVYRQCSLALQAELGVAPSPATERLRETIAGGQRGSTRTEVERAAALLQRGQHREAWAICAAAEAMGPDPVTAGQIALLRAEIAMRQGQQGQVLALIQEARRMIGGWGLQ